MSSNVIWSTTLVQTENVYQGMKRRDFGDPLTYAPQACQSFNLFSDISQEVLDGFIFFFLHFHCFQMMIPNDYDDPLAFPS